MKITARGLLTGIWGGLGLTALAAPLLVGIWPVAGVLTYRLFSLHCHQLPERSFTLLHLPLAVCQRCSGIYLGFFLGTLLSGLPQRLRLSTGTRRNGILAAALLLTLDALLPHTGIWSNTPTSRFLTGLLFGGVIAPLLVEALQELLERYNTHLTWTLRRRGDATVRAEASHG